MVAVITRRMLAIRPRNFTLIFGQLGAGIAAWGFLLVPLIVLAVAAFRPERSPETTQTLHDLGWMLLIYFNLWVALSFMPGGVIPLFKTGPLAYNGVFAFWIPFAIFFVWLVVMPVVLHRAIIEDQAESDESVMETT